MSISFIGCCNIIEQDDRFLLVRESKDAARGLYNLPAGGWEPGETIVEGCIREAKEETGLDVEPQYFVGLYERKLTRENGTGLNCVAYSKVVSGELTVSDEHPEVKFFSYDEIVDLDRKGLLRGPTILAAIQDYQAGRRLPLDTISATD